MTRLSAVKYVGKAGGGRFLHKTEVRYGQKTHAYRPEKSGGQERHHPSQGRRARQDTKSGKTGSQDPFEKGDSAEHRISLFHSDSHSNCGLKISTRELFVSVTSNL